MAAILFEQLLVLCAAAVLLGVPGTAAASILAVRRALPDALAVPCAALLGSLVACVATGVQLGLRQPVEVAVATHAALSLALVVGALAMARRRRRQVGRAAPVERGWGWSTSVVVLVAGAFAWMVRGAIRLDGLYHVALSRKLVDLAEPTFSNVNRFADGGPNPVYALPGWHALVGWSSWIVGSDPIVAWEVMPVLVVVLGALAAGGLARVLLATPLALPLGAGAWVLMRVLYARREVDGDAITYGAVPGQVTFEIALPLVVAAIAVAMHADDRSVRRIAMAVITAGIVATVAYHANYLPYVAIIGLGYAAWWLVDRERRGHGGRRLLVVGGWVAGVSVACMLVVLPLLAQLENFGNAPEGDRIDYHLAQTLGMAHVRGGHAWEMLGLPGLLALLAAPLLAWRVRSSGYMIVSGGLLALLSFSFLPPLFQLLRATGSLTLLLRINHAVGMLLVVAFAALVLELARVASGPGWSRRRRLRWGVGAFVLLVLAGVGIGYDRFGADLPGYLAWAGLVAVLAGRAVQRVRHAGGSQAATHAVRDTPRPAASGVVAATAFVLALGLALPVGAISMRRALARADSFTEPTSQGELKCIGGAVATAVQRIRPGSVVLSDPVASFRAMALAPAYVVGDYKVWNAATRDNRASERLAAVNAFFDASRPDAERLRQLDEQAVDYVLVDLRDGRWLDAGVGSDQHTQLLAGAQDRLHAFADVQSYDGGDVARLVARNPARFRQLAVDQRAREAALPARTASSSVPCNSYVLWQVRR